MIKKLLPRRAGEFLIATTLVTGMTAGFASSAFAADPSPTQEKSCSFSDIGDELITIDSTAVTPVVTHFTSFNVTAGTLSENTYRLNVVNRVATSVNGNSTDTRTLFDQVSSTVGFGVRDDDSTTDTQEATVKWRFNSPGYYGLYKGTERVTGAYSRSVCGFNWGSPSYSRRGGGTFSTFGPIEEGTVVCTDPLPAGTVRQAAQTLLGCTKQTPATPTAKSPATPAKAAK